MCEKRCSHKHGAGNKAVCTVLFDIFSTRSLWPGRKPKLLSVWGADGAGYSLELPATFSVEGPRFRRLPRQSRPVQIYLFFTYSLSDESRRWTHLASVDFSGCWLLGNMPALTRSHLANYFPVAAGVSHNKWTTETLFATSVSCFLQKNVKFKMALLNNRIWSQHCRNRNGKGGKLEPSKTPLCFALL